MVRYRQALVAAAILVSSLGVLAGSADAAPVRPADASSTATHVVRPGDHLLAIARKHGVLLNDLLAANGLTVDSVIQPGDVLTLPSSTRPPTQGANAAPAPVVSGASPGTTYTVHSGDYLVGIAARHGVTLSALLRANSLDVTSTIVPGSILAVPAATLPIPAPTAATPASAATTPAPPAATTPPTASPATPAPTGPAGRFQVLRTFLEAQVGKPYKFNAAGPDTYDCSGLVVAAFAQVGVQLPHQSLLLSKAGADVDWHADGIAPGDLIFVYSSATPGQIGHVGVALTPTTWIQAVGTGVPVRVRAIPAADKIRAVRRVL